MNAITAKVDEMEKNEEEEEEKLGGVQGSNETGEAPKKKKIKKDLNITLNYTTGDYADDEDLYKPRISREQRVLYWQHLVQNKGRKVPPASFTPWIKIFAEEAKDEELKEFPSLYIIILGRLVSNVWDYCYLFLFLVWLVLLLFRYDTKFNKMISPGLVPAGIPEGALHLPLLLMFLCQLIPCIGASYCIVFWNDLVKVIARKKLSNWSFVAVLLAQYFEFNYYGGQNREDKAGKVRSAKDLTWKEFLSSICCCGKKDAAVVPQQLDVEFYDPYAFADMAGGAGSVEGSGSASVHSNFLKRDLYDYELKGRGEGNVFLPNTGNVEDDWNVQEEFDETAPAKGEGSNNPLFSIFRSFFSTD